MTIYTILVNDKKHTYYLSHKILGCRTKKIPFANVRGTDHPRLMYYSKNEGKAIQKIEKLTKKLDKVSKQIITFSIEKIYLED